ncbi:hypothetical protein M917_1818 [Psychrobacter aquaticus CMS 56]|uniref:Uncharacterized protein n=1 Tax=Psychrobacter aquaticus CMS 56 TaxID=1354303 RepID=U4T998_9GAMM|nr:hypothetical protein M917_1818 [Psychrobacter aquaticus CMS 56]
MRHKKSFIIDNVRVINCLNSVDASADWLKSLLAIIKRSGSSYLSATE